MSQSRVYTYGIPGDLEFIGKPKHSAASVAGTLDLIAQVMRRDLEEHPDHPLAHLAVAVLCHAEATRRKLLTGGNLSAATAELERIERLISEAKRRAQRRHAECGQKVLQGGRKGHEAAYGTAEQKAARKRAFQEAVGRTMSDGSGMSYNRACEKVAGACGVCPKTVKRQAPRKTVG